jgi:hypothetical protein
MFDGMYSTDSLLKNVMVDGCTQYTSRGGLRPFPSEPKLTSQVQNTFGFWTVSCVSGQDPCPILQRRLELMAADDTQSRSGIEAVP